MEIERINDYDYDNDADMLLTGIGSADSVAVYTHADGFLRQLFCRLAALNTARPPGAILTTTVTRT